MTLHEDMDEIIRLAGKVKSENPSAPAPTPVPPPAPLPPAPPPAQSVPDFRPRRNKRFISWANGSQSNNGLTPSSAWQQLGGKAGQIPNDTEVIFLDGMHSPTLVPYSSWSSRTGMGNGITFRSEGYRGATLSGAANQSGEAFTMWLNGERDIEFWGLNFTKWRGVGQIIPGRDVDGIRAIGCAFANNGTGTEARHHNIYLSHGATFDTAPRNIEIAYCESDEPLMGGCFIHAWDSASNYFQAHHVKIHHNKIAGPRQLWGILVNANFKRTNPCHWSVADNDIRILGTGPYNGGALHLNASDPEPMDGADSTFVLERNILAASQGPGLRVGRVGGQPHAPTLRDNRYWTRVDGASLGSGDVVAAP